jgi:hypothetical protein
MPKAEEGGADAELQYVEVIKDTEDPQANPADEGKPRCINLIVLKFLQLSLNDCAFMFRS